MSFRTIAMIAVFAAAIFGMARCSSDPHRTALPFGSTDLTSVEKQLAALPAEERALVEAYVARSGGDVLTPQFADPDDPLTARTFAQAIELQKRWNEKMGVLEQRLSALRVEREGKLAPLRALVRATVVKSEVVTRNEYQARQDPGFYSRAYQVDKSPTFISLIRVQNRSNERILAVKGSLKAQDRDQTLPLDLCWIDLGSDHELAPGATTDFYCGNVLHGVSEQQRDFIALPAGRFQVEWIPKYVKLASGREIDSDVDW